MDKPVAFAPSPATLRSVEDGNEHLKVSNESSLQASIHIEPLDRNDPIYAENKNHQFIMSTLRETQEESSDSQSYFKAAIHF